jgi:hypothetical protein
MAQFDSKRFNDSASSSQELSSPRPIEPGTGKLQQLQALADREHSSVSRIVKLAVIELLKRQAPPTSKSGRRR